MIGAKIGKTMEKGLANSQKRLAIVNLQVDYEDFVAIHSLGAMPVTALKARKKEDSVEKPEAMLTSAIFLSGCWRSNCWAYSMR